MLILLASLLAASPLPTGSDAEKAALKGDFVQAAQLAKAAQDPRAASFEKLAEGGKLRSEKQFGAARHAFRKAAEDARMGGLAQYWVCTSYSDEGRGAEAKACFDAAKLDPTPQAEPAPKSGITQVTDTKTTDSKPAAPGYLKGPDGAGLPSNNSQDRQLKEMEAQEKRDRDDAKKAAEAQKPPPEKAKP